MDPTRGGSDGRLSEKGGSGAGAGAAADGGGGGGA
jgi:hypothetical protein